MFCSECGKQATGKFCWNCGAALDTAGQAAVPPPSPAADWRYGIDYRTLMSHPEVRDLLARQLPAESRMTAEEFVDSFGKLSKAAGVPMMGAEIMVPVMRICQEVYGRMGIHTGKTRSQTFQLPPGRVIVAATGALATGGQKIQEVRQALDGCVFIAEIPSDMFSFTGKLVVAVQREAGGTSVRADTKIEGQLMDWGKSTRCLDHLFQAIAG